ncbi:MAG: peptide deformylase [Spirochaetes bacterium GWF1_31_7]|nr:MAG: peptide deformylase [Spirochaetes bacterium GWE1_32_154]OHD48191.1 MAG: peptide deformylase [Spirochaetes bacterium GWE2_31_10]OHD50600.1 MAG: peptide deformylase [Spirochaetes bacterium GWF1_31_7]OHD80446.1 MAG: peptide deformylase [Spirochaetes bacterium RIFOXYB1_FULL_32_8]HBD94545.1 peptide deformylase [Spirochaetia bacterium]
MKYNVVKYPDERLKLPSSSIDIINDELKELIVDMFEVMYATDGIGLSAVQIGIHKRLFVMDVPGKGKMAVINPKISEVSKETSTYEEGCLSLPGISADITRPKKVKLEYTDVEGKPAVLKASGLLATCIQHEYDHLDGKLFVDRLKADEKLKKLMEYRKFNNL